MWPLPTRACVSVCVRVCVYELPFPFHLFNAPFVYFELNSRSTNASPNVSRTLMKMDKSVKEKITLFLKILLNNAKYFYWVLGKINLCLIDLSVYPCSIQFHPDYPKLVTTTTTTQQQQQHLPQPCQHQWDAHRKTWERREREREQVFMVYTKSGS